MILHKDILHSKISKEEIEQAFQYVGGNPESESLREIFFKMLEQSDEARNRRHYLTKAVIVNAYQDARYNPISDGGIAEIADFENQLEGMLFGEAQEPYRRERRKVGANEPCPCGSGKKFKKCCRGNGRYD